MGIPSLRLTNLAPPEGAKTILLPPPEIWPATSESPRSPFDPHDLPPTRTRANGPAPQMHPNPCPSPATPRLGRVYAYTALAPGNRPAVF